MVVVEHRVASGETLTQIAKQYGTTVSAIQAANTTLIKNVNAIRAGWVLKIPKEEPATDCKQIVEQFNSALKDIENLESVKALTAMLGG